LLFRSLLLLKELERALLGDIARLLELLDRLLARGVLLLGNDATLLGLHQVLLGQATGSVLGRAVPHLRLGANSGHLAAHHVVLAHSHVVAATLATRHDLIARGVHLGATHHVVASLTHSHVVTALAHSHVVAAALATHHLLHIIARSVH
jgi:hypothetical protein